MLWQSWGDERLAMRGLKRAKIGDSTQFWLIFAVSFLFFHQYEQHFVNNVAQASSHTKSYVLAVKRGSRVSYQGPQKGQKWWFDLVLINSFCYFSCFSTNTFTSISTSTNTKYNLRECGPGIFLLHCTKVPSCDSKEGMNGQPSRASKRPKVAIWLSAD